MKILLSSSGWSKSRIKAYIELNYLTLDFTLDQIRDIYRFNETWQDTVPQALQAYLDAESFDEAIRNAISIGSDIDTLAAIAGSIAEAYYGVPTEMVEGARHYLDKSGRVNSPFLNNQKLL